MDPTSVTNATTKAAGDGRDFLPRGPLAELDPDAYRLIRHEDERQRRRIILIASESICPEPVRRAVASRFSNIYAEGYPSWRMTEATNERPLDYVHHLAYYRRYADGRYYKGCDYVDFAETLAQKRIRALFASARAPAAAIQANVQPLSGAAANNAVYEALCNPGDVVLGMNLAHGGHLTHGSPINRSGKRYRVIPYGVDLATGRIDYDQVLALAREHRPRMIIGGASAYPFAIDWERLRAAADAAGAYLLADIAHPAGLVVAGLFPNPVGIADVTTFTTHKTLCGPRGACILTTDPKLGAMMNTAVFPGEQGGPHINTIIAKAVAFGLVGRPAFRQMMQRVRENIQAMCAAFEARGIALLGGGSESHLLMIDLDALPSPTGLKLKGEVASRILELAGIVLNKNTKPGDTSAAHPGAVRIGTVWISQLGYSPKEAEEIADIIATLLRNIHPFRYMESRTYAGRGKVDLGLLEECRQRVDALTHRFPPPDDVADAPPAAYPHYEPILAPRAPAAAPESAAGRRAALEGAALVRLEHAAILELSAERSHYTVHSAFTSDTGALAPMSGQRAFLLDRQGAALDDVSLLRLRDLEPGQRRFLVLASSPNAEKTKRWLRALSDGYVLFDRDDVFKKVEGPALVVDRASAEDSHEPDRAPLLGLFGLYGPEAPKVMMRLWDGPPLAHAGALAEGTLGGVSATVHRTALGGKAGVCFEIMVAAEHAAALASAVAAHATPAGPGAVDAVREASGLPDYRERAPEAAALAEAHPEMFAPAKVYFVGHQFVPPTLAPKADYRPDDEALPVRRTPLYEEHVRLGGNMVPFAGWEMPVRYRTSIAEEHAAVRQACGLFDVSHMGVLGFRGEPAQRFLDAVTTNYVAWLRDGQCHYSYLCRPDGRVIDDILVYRRAWDDYMVVVNAANAETDLAWIRAVGSGGVKIDADFPWKVADGVGGGVEIRDLRDPASGADRRVDLALQGPRADAVLAAAGAEPTFRAALKALKRFEFARGAVGGIDVVASRTGYTGSDGYELYVHPERAVALWRTLLEKGAPLGLMPTGLGARDSTRTEAGFPLYGHELAGPYDISPIEAGYGNSVKFHKPFFIGRAPLLVHENERTREVVRMRLPGKGVKMVRTGNPVLNRRGEFVGTVTSGVLVGEEQVALAIVDRRFAKCGTPLSVLPLPSRLPEPRRYDQLAKGDAVVLPLEAVVIKRFL
ncbi:MAG: glycine cleavage system aminomethyltransferase GcvT [Planctomycetes bacterium]|nr:glycine cleavage system aminomethyltransferase GcvT [Planctomycetota bacterium]